MRIFRKSVLGVILTLCFFGEAISDVLVFEEDVAPYKELPKGLRDIKEVWVVRPLSFSFWENRAPNPKDPEGAVYRKKLHNVYGYSLLKKLSLERNLEELIEPAPNKKEDAHVGAESVWYLVEESDHKWWLLEVVDSGELIILKKAQEIIIGNEHPPFYLIEAESGTYEGTGKLLQESIRNAQKEGDEKVEKVNDARQP